MVFYVQNQKPVVIIGTSVRTTLFTLFFLLYTQSVCVCACVFVCYDALGYGVTENFGHF